LFASRAEAEVMFLSQTHSTPITMVDGNGDGNTEVDITILSLGSGYDFGYWDSGTFNLISDMWMGSATFDGGSVVDFAIRDSDDNILRLSDDSAELHFSLPVDASNAQVPVMEQDYWQSLQITWDLGNNNHVIAGIGGVNDGFAPVPEPASLALLGVGALAAATVVGRRRKSRAGKSRS